MKDYERCVQMSNAVDFCHYADLQTIIICCNTSHLKEDFTIN